LCALSDHQSARNSCYKPCTDKVSSQCAFSYAVLDY
jgi:hypothetical protein